MFVRTVLDNFQISLADAYYLYLVYKPLGISLYNLRNQFAAKILPKKILKLTLHYILLALDFLYTEADIVHTSIVTLIPSNHQA